MLESELARRVEAAVGPLGSARALTGAGQGEVWRVELARGGAVVVKRHRDRIAWRREVAAYREWMPALQPWLAPLRAVLDDAIVLDWIDARPGDDPSLADDVRAWLHAEAGRFRRALSELPFTDADSLSLPDAIAARCERLAERAAPLLPRPLVDATLAGIDPASFAGIRRVPCHRDFAPRNWLLVEHPRRLVVLDFAAARPDPWLADLVELWAGAWHRHPDTRNAFFTGFGRNLDEAERDQLRQLTLLHGLTTAVWGREHHAPDFIAHGDAILARLAAR